VTTNDADAGTRLSTDDIDLFTIAPDGIIIVDGTGLITRINDLAAEMFGYTPNELIGAPVERLLPERLREQHVEHRKSYAGQPSRRPMGLTIALVGRRKDGEEVPVDISLNHCQTADGDLRIIAFVRDATSRRRILDELRSSEENFRLLVEGVGDHAILMLDPFGRVVTWNQGAQRIKGWNAIDILGRHFSVFYLPEDIAAGQPERDLELAAAEGRTQSEGWRVRSGGQRFWAETTLSAVRDDGGVLRGFAKVTRDRTENHQARARLETFAELNRAALEQRPEDDLLELVVSRARAMVGASLVAAWSPGGEDGSVVAYADGDLSSTIIGTRAAPDSLVATTARRAKSELVLDLRTDARVPPELAAAGFTSGLFVPLHAAGETFAVLGVMTTEGRGHLQHTEVDLLEAFGVQAAASFALARARRDVEELHLVSDRERIARDLHDTVIQRLFAVGLSLEAASRLPATDTTERLQQAVSDIDDTIRSIRSSIFTLEDRSEHMPGLRRQVLAVASDASRALGFEPSVRFTGPVDTLTSEAVTDSLVAALREALANVARHAHATESNVTVTAADDIVLVVDDDGGGAASFQRAGGHGVANLHERARMLGGRASITARSPRGTRVEWSVPTPH
jgi:PAS domain S-box-containing protein